METTTCINIICNGNKDVNPSFKNTVGKRFSALKKKIFSSEGFNSQGDQRLQEKHVNRK